MLPARDDRHSSRRSTLIGFCLDSSTKAPTDLRQSARTCKRVVRRFLQSYSSSLVGGLAGDDAVSFLYSASLVSMSLSRLMTP